jgi:hypothetical protein
MLAVVYASPPRRRHIQHSSRWLSAKTTTHLAPIPQEVAGSSRPYRTIPATPVSKDPAHGGNPRTSPPRPEAARPACHAGGRGFESRRSRRKTCKSASSVAGAGATTAGLPIDLALIPYARPLSGKALEMGADDAHSRFLRRAG